MSLLERRGRSRQQNGGNAHSLWSGKPQIVEYFEPGVAIPTVITKSLTDEQLNSLAKIARISQINWKFTNHRLVPDSGNRSPSPPPVYNKEGRRINTREDRYRKKYNQERDELLSDTLKMVPGYCAPFWLKKPSRLVRKLMIPVDERPDINFIGLLIGPRGNTLRRITRESGAKVGIRGRGSVKTDHASAEMTMRMKLDEPLHCEIQGEDEQQVSKAIKLCKEVIDKAMMAGPGENDLKRNQLKELAILNGTLREESEHLCSLCGKKGHARSVCPLLGKQDFTQTLVCSRCGNIGHLAKDCKVDLSGVGVQREKIMDREFETMMKDLNGEKQTDGQKEVHEGIGGDRHDEGHERYERQEENGRYGRNDRGYGSNYRSNDDHYRRDYRQNSRNHDEYGREGDGRSYGRSYGRPDYGRPNYERPDFRNDRRYGRSPPPYPGQAYPKQAYPSQAYPKQAYPKQAYPRFEDRKRPYEGEEPAEKRRPLPEHQPIKAPPGLEAPPGLNLSSSTGLPPPPPGITPEHRLPPPPGMK